MRYWVKLGGLDLPLFQQIGEQKCEQDEAASVKTENPRVQTIQLTFGKIQNAQRS